MNTFELIAAFAEGITVEQTYRKADTVTKKQVITVPMAEDEVVITPNKKVTVEKEVVMLPSWCKSYATGKAGEKLERPAYIR